MPVLDFPAAPPPHTVCWVRVTRQRPDGFVEFDFAMGDPELAVDLILPQAAFAAFCAEHQVRLIGDAQAAALAAEQAKWRYGPPGLTD
jgi:phenol hydroxylase P0 protein